MKFLMLIALFSLSVAGSAMASPFEACWGFRQDGFPTSNVLFKVTQLGEAKKYKVVIYNNGQYFTSVTADKQIRPGGILGSDNVVCALYAYAPQSESEQGFPYTVTFDLVFMVPEDMCKDENFEVPASSEPEYYDPSRSLGLRIHRNRQMMMNLHSFEPIKVACPAN